MRQALTIALGVALVSCSSSGDDVDRTPLTPSDYAAEFPLGLAVASPFARDSGASSALTERGAPKAIGGASSPLAIGGDISYATMVGDVSSVVSGSVALATFFDPGVMFVTGTDARCFGPQVPYSGHPDGSPTDGILPGGDLGMWTETESMPGFTVADACSVAETNARLTTSSYHAWAGLVLSAAMLREAVLNGALPSSDGDSANVRSDMNALGTAMTFSEATVSMQSGRVHYDATFTYDYAPPPPPDSTTTHVPATQTVSVHLDFGSGNGTMNTRVTGTSEYFTGFVCSDSDRTLVTSVRYVLDASGEVELQARSATLCGHSSDGLDADGVVDPSDRVPSNPSGWSENFGIFVAEFDANTMAGNYVYAWQAGSGDVASRILSLGVNDHSPLDGEAFFGYGEDIASTDGNITGFYCGWASPGSPGTLYTDRAQRQFVRADGDFFPPVDSDITYAPTDSCEYDGSGSFVFDTDLDGDLSGEAGGAVTSDLWDTTVGTTTYGSIAEAIASRHSTPTAANTGGWPAP